MAGTRTKGNGKTIKGGKVTPIERVASNTSKISHQDDDLHEIKSLLKDYSENVEKLKKSVSDIKEDSDEKAEESKKQTKELKNLKKSLEDGQLSSKLILNTVATGIGQSIASASKSISNSIDSALNKYVQSQQQNIAGLFGSGQSLSGINSNLTSALQNTNLVKQEAVYTKLTNLIQQGVVYNVEQRAFLQTLADDINLTFGDSGSLNRLIRIIGKDITDSQVGLAFTLQTALNSTYKNSEYMRGMFSSVQSAMSEMMALAGGGVGLESAVQSNLGSLYSAGVSDSTISSLAQQLNKLGTGDIDGLGSGLSALLIMAASRQGLDIGNILNGGLDANTINSLMAGASDYMTMIGSNSSNVVKSQLAKVFGINVSDLAAMNRFNRLGVVTADTDINNLFGNYGSFVNAAARRDNQLSNWFWGMAQNIGDNSNKYGTYQLLKLIAGSGLGDLVGAFGDNQDGLFGGFLPFSGTALLADVLGWGLNSAPMLYALAAGGGFTGGLSSLLNGGFNLGSLFGFGGLNNDSSLAAVWSALGGGSNNYKVSSGEVSNSAYIGEGEGMGLNSMISSITEEFSGDEETVPQKLSTTNDTLTLISESLDEIKQLLSTHYNDSANYSTTTFGGYNGPNNLNRGW